MSFLAVSAALVLGTGQMNKVGVGPIAEGMLMLGSIANPSGVAVQVHRDGLFLASSNLVPTDTLSARTGNGKDYTVRVVARDDITQLTLIRAEGWKPGQGRVFHVANEREVSSQKVSAVLPTGVIAGQLVSTSRTGILQSSRRYVRLWEIRLESTAQKLGGAPVFTLDGRLAGVINATLEPYTTQEKGELTTQKISISPRHFGPGGLTVGYALGPKVLGRVVTGFLNEDRTPLHPTVGMLFKRAEAGGVEITSVTAGSSAERAGLEVGDILLKLAGETVVDAFWLAARLFESEIGESLNFQFRRGDQNLRTQVMVESLAEARREKPAEPAKTTPKTPVTNPSEAIAPILFL